MSTPTEYTDDLFLMAWGRVMANFANLPELLRIELDPFREKVTAAAKHGRPCIELAAQINEITTRHVFARVVPFDLSAHRPNAFPELNDEELKVRLQAASRHNPATGYHHDPYAALVLHVELVRRLRIGDAAHRAGAAE